MSESGSAGTQRRCFVARPISISDEVAAHYSGDRQHWRHVEEHLIAPALQASGYTQIPTPASGAVLIHGHVIEAINSADLVIADFSRLNANVLFEAGVRTSVNKPLLVIAEEGTTLPFDTAGINTFFYDPRLQPWALGQMVTELVGYIKQTKTQGNALWTQFGVPLQVEDLAAANPKDPTAGILEQIWIEVREMRSQHDDLVRRVPAPALSGDFTRHSEVSSTGKLVALTHDLLLDRVSNAGQPDAMSGALNELFYELHRKDVVMGDEHTRSSLLLEMKSLVSGTGDEASMVAFEEFARAYTAFVNSHRIASWDTRTR